MPDPIITPTYGFPIVEPTADVATLEFQNWMASITDAVNAARPLTGAGDPNGVQVARSGQWYVDTIAADIWFKESGDGNTGWILTT